MDKGPLTVAHCSDWCKEIQDLYDKGLPPGCSTGWSTIDPYYTVLPGQFTLVTGVPSHGKTTWTENLAINLAFNGWKFCVYSPEQEPPEVHMATLIEKVVKKPFARGFNNHALPDDLAFATAFIDEHFQFLRLNPESNELPDLPMLIQYMGSLLKPWIENAVEGENFGIIIDPWNELAHNMHAEQSETMYISSMLGLFRRFCRAWNIHGWIVAHPKQLQKGKDGTYPIPRPYDISGSAHWYNKADCCVTVWRDDNDQGGDLVMIDIQKVRFRHVGKKGHVYLSFDRGNGTYADIEPHWSQKGRTGFD